MLKMIMHSFFIYHGICLFEHSQIFNMKYFEQSKRRNIKVLSTFSLPGLFFLFKSLVSFLLNILFSCYAVLGRNPNTTCSFFTPFYIPGDITGRPIYREVMALVTRRLMVSSCFLRSSAEASVSSRVAMASEMAASILSLLPRFILRERVWSETISSTREM